MCERDSIDIRPGRSRDVRCAYAPRECTRGPGALPAAPPGARRWWPRTWQTFRDPQRALREAIRTDELTRFLNGGTLVAVWRDLFLPQAVRQAWEDRHPVLRRPAAV
jgi:hypothetical protein